MASAADNHAALMDSVYRGQRHIYDATRKYFLFGRDTMIEELNCRPGQHLLEVGCGTGRNLAKIARRWPEATLYGLDISSEMLKSAGAALDGRARLALGDATHFDPAGLLGHPNFERVAISFAVSMIPAWKAAVAQAAEVLAPGGVLKIVDFGDLAGVPAPLRAGLRAWLTHFHVTPRDDLAGYAAELSSDQGLIMHSRRGPLGYYQILTITRPAGFD
jgi:S-adenosylmethionine-diacylgycerolhomoserine-N-methlytransferase